MEDESRRKADVQIGVLQQQLRDFRDVYEKDAARARMESAEMLATIKSHDDFIRDIRPMYEKGMIAWGAFLVGSVGVGVHWLWKHLILNL